MTRSAHRSNASSTRAPSSPPTVRPTAYALIGASIPNRPSSTMDEAAPGKIAGDGGGAVPAELGDLGEHVESDGLGELGEPEEAPRPVLVEEGHGGVEGLGHRVRRGGIRHSDDGDLRGELLDEQWQPTGGEEEVPQGVAVLREVDRRASGGGDPVQAQVERRPGQRRPRPGHGQRAEPDDVLAGDAERRPGRHDAPRVGRLLVEPGHRVCEPRELTDPVDDEERPRPVDRPGQRPRPGVPGRPLAGDGAQAPVEQGVDITAGARVDPRQVRPVARRRSGPGGSSRSRADRRGRCTARRTAPT